MCSGKEELSGIMVSMFRCAGTCVGTIAAAGKKVTGIVTSGVVAVGHLFTRPVDTPELIVAGQTESASEGLGSRASKEKIESSTKTVVPYFDEEVSVKIKEQPSQAASEARIPSLSAITDKRVQAAVFDQMTDKILFAKAVSDIVNQDVITRLDAVKTIAGIRHELSVKALVAQVASDPSAQVRQECIKGLTALGMKEGLSAVKRALADEADLVRLAAVWGLYRLAGTQSGTALVRMLSDKDEGVRRRAATCIGWLGQGSFAVELTILLDDESVSVRQAAVEAMSNLGNRQVVSSLIEHLKDPNKPTRKIILDTIEKITDKKIGKSFPANKAKLDRLIARWRQWWKEEMLK